MSTSALPPTAPTTLVILLGASAWPNSPGFQASRAFEYAANGFRDYVLDPHGLGLPAANLFDRFDTQAGASDQLEVLDSFLEQRARVLKAANYPVRDVLVYFVGHGGFAGPSADFYLMPRRANASSLKASGMAIDALAEVLRERARQTRRYLLLDCCFAAAAFRSFQGGPDQTAITKTLDAFYVGARGSGFPREGTALLCSSDQKSPSLLLPDESCTMFSYALLHVLRNGDPHRPQRLSLRDLKELAEDRLAALPEKNAPRPGLHSPDQSEGDVAAVPLFPNSRSMQTHVPDVTPSILSQPFPSSASLHTFRPAQGLVPRPPSVPPPSANFPQHPPALPPQPLPNQLKRLRSPSLLAILLAVILLCIGGLGINAAVAGNWPWSPPHGLLTPIPSAKTTTATATSTAQATASTLGQTWHVQDSGTSESLYGVTWSGALFVGVGDMGTILTSPDGSTWTDQPSGTLQHLSGVGWFGGQFIAVGRNGTILASYDGRRWFAEHSGTSEGLYGVAWSGAQFVVTGDHGTILTSPNGSTWTAQRSGTSQALSGVAWSGTQFVVVGNHGTILTSPDGSTWTAQQSGTLDDLIDVAWSGALSVVVGWSDTILTSPDGRTWTAQQSGSAQNLIGVTWSGALFVVVGIGSTILTSPDGRTWTAHNAGTAQGLPLISVARSGTQLVVVGGSGTILTSP